MNIRKHICCLFVSLLLTGGVVVAQSTHAAARENTHLELFQGWGDDIEMKEYHIRLFSLLHRGFADKRFARYTVNPSFHAEYALSVEQKSGEYYVLSRTLSANYWYAGKNRDAVTADLKTCTIEEPLYQLIGELFTLVTDQIGPVPPTHGMDGTTYYFSRTNEDGKVVTGEVWSPIKDSPMRKLVEICDALYELSLGKDVSPADIEKDIHALMNDLRE